MYEERFRYSVILLMGLLLIYGPNLSFTTLDSVAESTPLGIMSQVSPEAGSPIVTSQLDPPRTSFYWEDFTTTTYLDETATNATGWGDGILRSRHKSPTLTGFQETPGNAVDLFVDGSLVYVADCDFGLQIINITDPSHPVIVGSYDTSGCARGVFVDGHFAYVADGLSGLEVINVTDSLHPSLVGTCDTPGYANSVSVSGLLAYIADDFEGLQVINITNPSQPAIVGFCDTPSAAISVDIAGNIAYMADWYSGLQLVDITSPLQPFIASSLDTPGIALDVFVDGNLAYIADHSSGLQVINITNSLRPSLVGSFDTPGYAYGVFVSGDSAYIADRSAGLQIINITNPSSPIFYETGTYDTPGEATKVWVWGERAFIVDNISLQVIRVANLADPRLIGFEDTSGQGYDVYVCGDFAYVADGISGLSILNIRNPSHPLLVGSYDTDDEAWGVFVEGGLAYVADETSGLLILNVTDPSHPSLVGSYDTPYSDYARDVFVSGGLAYVAFGVFGLQIINVTNPSEPSFVGELWLPLWPEHVHVRGNMAYVTAMNALVIINVTDPSQPYQVGVYGFSEYLNDIFVSGNFAYIAAGELGLKVVDVTDPSQPSLVGSYDTTGSAYGLSVSGTIIYLADSTLGLQILNVTDPSQISLVYSYETSIYGVFVSGDYAYITSTALGLQVIEVMWHLCRQYEPVCMGQSLPVFDSLSAVVKGATLLDEGIEPPDTQLEFYLSADNGSHWELVIPDIQSNFTYEGKQLMWRAMFTTSYALRTPRLFYIVIAYVSVLDAPVLVAPDNGELVEDNEPTFMWELVSGATCYRIQLDRVTGFDSPNLIDATVVALTYVPDSALANGPWFWRVAASDINGEWGEFSPIRTFEIEVGVLTWDQIPTSQVVEYGEAFRYDLNATGPGESLTYWVNSTAFSIDVDGVLVNTTILLVGEYPLMINVTDEYDSIISSEILVTVQDITIPDWIQEPSYQIVEVGEPFRLQLSAIDLSGIDHYWLNTTVLSVDDTGLISNATFLPYGRIPVEVRVYDIYDNFRTSVFTVFVNDTQFPLFLEVPADIEYTFGDTENHISWTFTDLSPLVYTLYTETELSGFPVWFPVRTIWWYDVVETVSFSVDGLDAGVYQYKLVINDAAGNVNEDYVTVTVLDATSSTTTTSTSTTSLTSDDSGAMLVVIAISGGVGLVVIILFVSVRMRRGN